MTDDGTRGDERSKRDGTAPVVELVVRRERRRVRAWAAVTVALWSLTALYLLVLVFAYLAIVHPAVNELLTGGELTPAARQQHAAAIIGGLKALCWWPVTLVVAAVCTIAFTLAARRATLRQIQAGLADISAQLKEMAPGS